MPDILIKLLLSHITWYGLSTAIALWLTLAPVLGKWNQQATAWAFGISAPAIASSIWLAQRLDQRFTLAQVSNQLGTQWEIDRMVDDLNLGRAQYEQVVQQMLGGDAPVLSQYQAMQAMMLNAGAMPQLASGPVIAEEDLAQTIATADSDEQNFLFVGKSRSGKTSLLVNAIHRKHQHLNSEVDWFIFNGKPERDNRWCGLAENPADYWEVNSEFKAMEMLSVFRGCIGALQDWQSTGQSHYPMYLIFDEVNNQRILLPTEPCKLLDKGLSLYATQCMSERSGLWISTHSHAVEDAGLNRRLQQSFQVIVMGRNGKYDSIADALNDYRLIGNKEAREQLKQQLQAYVAMQGKGAIALTNVGGAWRLVQLPVYGKDISVTDSTALTQSKSVPLSVDGADVLPEATELETMYQQSTVASLPQELQTILSKASEQGGAISVREANRLSGIVNKFSADEVRGFFDQLQAAGWGAVQQDTGDSRRQVFWLFDSRRADL